MIVSGICSLRAYQKCLNTKDLSLQDCINICQAEDANQMQVQDCRPESVNVIESAQTIIPVNRLQQGPNESSNFNRHKKKSNKNCYYCGAPNCTREHSKVCKAKNSTCGKCGKKGHLDSLCRSNAHVRDTRLAIHSFKSRSLCRLHPKSRDCTILHTILHIQRCVTTSELVTWSHSHTPSRYEKKAALHIGLVSIQCLNSSGMNTCDLSSMPWKKWDDVIIILKVMV